MRCLGILLVVPLVVPWVGVMGGCAGEPATTSDPSSTSSATTATSGPTTGDVDACMGTNDCDTDDICVAAYIPNNPPPGGARGASSCAPVSDCIGALDLGRWCFDHQGCCEDLRCRRTDGICEPAELGQDLTDSGSESSDTATTTTGNDDDDSDSSGDLPSTSGGTTSTP